MHVNQRRRLAVEERGTLPIDLLGVILTKADVETKLACALANSALRQELLTSRCWRQEVRLDLRDSRQLKWLQKHITVLEKLSICLEYSLVGRFNCLLRQRGAPHLTSLSIHMSPDQAEHYSEHYSEHHWTFSALVFGRRGRGLFFELRSLRLVDLRVYHRESTPVLSTHNLPATLRKLTFGECQSEDAQVFFRGQAGESCLYRHHGEPWYFAHLLPASVKHLRLLCSAHNLLEGLKQIEQCCNLQELDVCVKFGDPGFVDPAGPGSVSLARALGSLCLKRVGLHVYCGYPINISDCQVAVVHRTCFIGSSRSRSLCLEDHIDHMSRRNVTKLTLHVRLISSFPCLCGFSALKELVIADSERYFGTASTMPLSLKALEVLAPTLRHLTVSSNSEETRVELPQGICLRSFVCVSRGHLLLQCDAHTLSQGLEDVILGYTTIAGTGVRLVEELAPRLSEVVLEVLGPESLRQCLLFTRPGLVGEWWHRVFQVSKERFWAGCWCGKVRIWAQGHLCPQYLNFPRYGISSAHEDREVFDPGVDPDVLSLYEDSEEDEDEDPYEYDDEEYGEDDE